MKRHLLLASLCLFLFTASCKGPNSLSLIGLDEAGNEIDYDVDKEIYQKNLTQYVQEMDTATVAALEATPNSTWRLSKVELGLSVTASLNLGPVWKASFSAGQRVIYTKN